MLQMEGMSPVETVFHIRVESDGGVFVASEDGARIEGRGESELEAVKEYIAKKQQYD